MNRALLAGLSGAVLGGGVCAAGFAIAASFAVSAHADTVNARCEYFRTGKAEPLLPSLVPSPNDRGMF
jgi:hypothetical protein